MRTLGRATLAILAGLTLASGAARTDAGMVHKVKLERSKAPAKPS